MGPEEKEKIKAEINLKLSAILQLTKEGISFSRYDNIIRDFPDTKLTKIINIARRILQNPTKKAIQKLAQDLIATTGHDEHLYFTD